MSDQTPTPAPVDPWWPRRDEGIPIGPINCSMEEQITEAWAAVSGFEGLYEVSNIGRVRSLPRVNRLGRRVNGCERKPQKDTKGYHFVQLWKDGAMSQPRVHQLVAAAFIPNPEQKPQVNHKDGVRSNNVWKNLEWATNGENTQHSYDVLNRKPSRSHLGRTGEKHHASIPVVATDVTTGDVKQFASMGEAGRAGFDTACVWMACVGRIKTHKGHRWSYLSTPAKA